MTGPERDQRLRLNQVAGPPFELVTLGHGCQNQFSFHQGKVIAQADTRAGLSTGFVATFFVSIYLPSSDQKNII